MERSYPAMHVAKIERRHGDRVYSYWLVRRSVREGKRVRHETVANVSKLPAAAVEALRRALAGEALVAAGEVFATERSLPHGHVRAVLAMAGRLGLARLLDRRPSRERSLVVAMVCQQVLAPGSKLACTRALGQSTLAEELALERADADELYAALDWLLERQERIEARLARRHLAEGSHVLYDVSSSYFEGRTCPLLALGYSRDGRRGTLQIVYGLLCDRAGRPVAIELFPGGVHDDKTLPAQIAKLRKRFGIGTLVLIVDRGMTTKANLATLAAADGIGWITALKAPQVKKLVKEGSLQLSLFDEQNLGEITSDDYPGERLVVCRNPLVAAERARKREDLLAATEAALAPLKARVDAGTLTGAAAIALAVGQLINKRKVKKHLELVIEDDRFAYSRKQAQIDEEAALDGFYVLRTNLNQQTLASNEVVRSYKQLAHAERAFRTLKGPELEIRPIRHRREDRVRAHAFLCLLAYYLEWHLRHAWAPLLFTDEQPPLAADPVAKAERSPEAKRKASTQRTADGEVCHSFPSLLAELALIVRNTNRVNGSEATFDTITESNRTQARAHQLIEQTAKLA
ncbi:MAG TPA: IS1634 family transposase [Gaiellaceae bacterium]|nr:IS1634 family transposase [Gaiellaceae bacterium]